MAVKTVYVEPDTPPPGQGPQARGRSDDGEQSVTHGRKGCQQQQYYCYNYICTYCSIPAQLSETIILFLYYFLG